ncbi:hypothetical protein ACW5R3_13485 [Bizionia sp. KMM 8389]
MKLEKLSSEKFKDVSINKDQMSAVKGGIADGGSAGGGSGAGTETPGGRITGKINGRTATFDYGFDSGRSQGVITYHNRSNITYHY